MSEAALYTVGGQEGGLHSPRQKISCGSLGLALNRSSAAEVTYLTYLLLLLPAQVSTGISDAVGKLRAVACILRS